MKLLITIVYFVSAFAAAAQVRTPMLPSFLIFSGTNSSCPVNIVHVAPRSWSHDRFGQNVLATNISLECMTAKSVTVKKEGGAVSLVVQNATMYLPVAGGSDLSKLQKLPNQFAAKTTFGLREDEFVQVNGEMLSADSLAEKFKSIPTGTK